MAPVVDEATSPSEFDDGQTVFPSPDALTGSVMTQLASIKQSLFNALAPPGPLNSAKSPQRE